MLSLVRRLVIRITLLMQRGTVALEVCAPQTCRSKGGMQLTAHSAVLLLRRGDVLRHVMLDVRTNQRVPYRGDCSAHWSRWLVIRKNPMNRGCAVRGDDL